MSQYKSFDQNSAETACIDNSGQQAAAGIEAAALPTEYNCGGDKTKRSEKIKKQYFLIWLTIVKVNARSNSYQTLISSVIKNFNRILKKNFF